MKLLTGIALSLGLMCSGGVYGQGCCYSPPLNPCSFSIIERGGVCPTFFTYRQKNDVLNFVSLAEALAVINTASEDPLTTFTVVDTALVQRESVRASKFSDQFNTPWIAGAEFSYAATCNTEIFIDGNYIGAEGKTDNYRVTFPAVAGVLDATGVGFLTPTDLSPRVRVRVREKFADLDAYTGYLGGRYYFSFCGNCVQPFIGTKAGFCYRSSVKARITGDFQDDAGERTPFSAGKITYYPSHTVVSAGFQLGANFCICDCFSIMFMVEAIGTGAFKFGNGAEESRGLVNTVTQSDVVPPILAEAIRQASNILEVPCRRSGAVMSFPVTLGLKFTF